MSEKLETYISKLSRREDVLKGALKCVLDALREQRSYCDALYDQMYSLAERIERMEDQGTFPVDKAGFVNDDAEAGSVSGIDYGKDSVEEVATTNSLSGCGGANSAIQLREVQQLSVVAEQQLPSTAPARANLEEITNEKDGAHVGHYAIEESIDSILEEHSKHADDRFASIKRNDAETKKKLREMMGATKRAPNLAL
jgi:hypothetical protein